MASATTVSRARQSRWAGAGVSSDTPSTSPGPSVSRHDRLRVARAVHLERHRPLADQVERVLRLPLAHEVLARAEADVAWCSRRGTRTCSSLEPAEEGVLPEDALEVSMTLPPGRRLGADRGDLLGDVDARPGTR